jgi:signal transduction histidine kinase/CheY-like chemotaxis protein
LSGSPAHEPAIQVLHTILILLIGWVTLYIPVFLPSAHPKGAPVAVAVSLLITYLGALVLLRRGRMTSASLVYLCGGWLVGTAAIAYGGGIRSAEVVFYLVLPISAAWLFGSRVAWLFSGVCLASLLLFAGLEQAGIGLPNYLSETPLGVWTTVAVALAITAIPVAYLVQSLRESLVRSRAAEKALESHKLGLEELLHLRTEQLDAARDQALAASRAKNAFLSSMSHELRSPLNAILLLCDPAWTDPDVPDEVRQNNLVVYRSATQLAKVIDAVLDSAQAEAAPMPAEDAIFDLHEVIHEVTERARVRTEEKGLKLLTEGCGTGPRFVWADGAKLRKALLRLADKALNRMDSGIVILRQEVTVPDSSACLMLRFEISNSSDSPAPAAAPRTPEVSSEIDGGESLAIIQRLIESIGGSVCIEILPGSGATTFCVEVPMRRANEFETRSIESATPRVLNLATGQPPIRVLIIEDSGEEPSFLHRLVEGAGFEVRVTGPGASGVQMFQLWRPHFMWIDRPLPERDGLETIRKIRGLDGGSEVSIAGVSAFGLARELEEMLAAGFDDFVHKPLRPIEVFDCMALHLGVRFNYDVLARSANE